MTCALCPTERTKARGLCARCYGRLLYRGELSDFPRTRTGDSWADVVEDIDLLIDARTSPHSISQRLGMKPKAIAEAAYRNGRNDIARPFWSLDRRERAVSS
jgi:hypothetical protein